MRPLALVVLFAFGSALLAQEADSEITRYINSLKAIDNHAHVIAVDPADKGFDQLRCEALPDGGPAPASWRFNADWASAIQSLYGFTPKDDSAAEMKRVDEARTVAMKQHGDQDWVLDKAGIATVLANRTELSAEMKPPRILWVPYDDSLLFPMNNEGLKSPNPDRAALFDMLDQLRSRYMQEAGVKQLPATLNDFLSQLVDPTLLRQKRAGAVAIKFEAAYLRALDFDEANAQQAKEIYAKYAAGAVPGPVEYKKLEDYLFKQIAIRAGRYKLAVHIHTGSGCGSYFNDPGADAMLLTPMLNDPELRQTNFVLLHGNFPQDRKILPLLFKPNVYVDTSVIEYYFTVPELADVLRVWLEQTPEHVLFGTDASPGSPGQNWPETALWGAAKFRTALALALTEMVKQGTITKDRALEIAGLVLRDNAARLYGIQ